MLPIGPLMKEHRLIERMVAVLEKQLRRMDSGESPDEVALEAAVDFFDTYADMMHYGKEEKYLFAALKEKQLSQEHASILDELLEEHDRARNLARRLDDARLKYLRGQDGAAGEAASAAGGLVELYPAHMKKEDDRFFKPSMEYFSDGEKDDMLEKFAEFDRHVIHDKYTRRVEQLEKQD